MICNILKEIILKKKEYLKKKKKYRNLNDIRTISEFYKNKNKNKKRIFEIALKKKVKKKERGIIAEIKKTSPLFGIIKKKFNPYYITKKYLFHKITCLSIITEKYYFNGSYDFLFKIKKNIKVPILCKDFIIDKYQIYEMFLWGADAILLIVSIIQDYNLLIELESCALSLNMSVLIEVNNYLELKMALKLKSKIIGINNRNLNTFKINKKNIINLSYYIPKDKLIISESGINNIKDINFINKFNIYLFLIGKKIIQSKNYNFLSTLLN